MANREYDVVVAGAGMVGAAFAALLATKQLASSEQGKKLRIAVLEARPFVMPDLSESFDPRVVALTARSRKLLEDVGVWEQIADRRVCPYQRMEVWEADGTGHIEFDCAEVRQPNLGHIVE
ncbi:MAG: 2-octaprenylphenol hydroxylase, partial [Porticoccus sp.]